MKTLTKKHIKKFYEKEKSMNRIVNKIIVKAIDILERESCGRWGITKKDIVDEVYEIALRKGMTNADFNLCS